MRPITHSLHCTSSLKQLYPILLNISISTIPWISAKTLDPITHIRKGIRVRFLCQILVHVISEVESNILPSNLFVFTVHIFRPSECDKQCHWLTIRRRLAGVLRTMRPVVGFRMRGRLSGCSNCGSGTTGPPPAHNTTVNLSKYCSTHSISNIITGGSVLFMTRVSFISRVMCLIC